MVLNHVFDIFWFERPFLLTAIIIIVAVFYSEVFHLYIIIHRWKRLKVNFETFSNIWSHPSTVCWLVPTRTRDFGSYIIQKVSSWPLRGLIRQISLLGASASFTSGPSSWSFESFLNLLLLDLFLLLFFLYLSLFPLKASLLVFCNFFGRRFNLFNVNSSWLQSEINFGGFLSQFCGLDLLLRILFVLLRLLILTQ